MNKKTENIIITVLIVVNLCIGAILISMINKPKERVEDYYMYMVDQNGNLNINGEVIKTENGFPKYVEDGYTQFNYLPNEYKELDLVNNSIQCFDSYCDITIDEYFRTINYNNLAIIEYNDKLYCNSKDDVCRKLYKE